jgi:hypothetical protein
MGEHRSDGDPTPDTDDETARLELPSLRLPRFGRRRKARDDGETTAPPAEAPPAEAPPTEASPADTHPADTHPTPPEPEPLPAPVPEPLPQPEPAPQRALVPTPDVAPPTHEMPVDEEPVDEPADEPATREPFTLPQLPGRVAAVLTGAVVGVVGVALTYLSLQGCDAVRGTKSCGGGPGLLLLLVILVLMVLLGGVLLALWDVSEPRSTSFLGVGVLAVVVLIASLRDLDSVWMFLVVPLVCALSFLLAQWVTTAFVELPEKGPQHDIR